MAAYKKKIIALLVIAALGGGVLVLRSEALLRRVVPAVRSVQSAAAGQATENSKSETGSLPLTSSTLLGTGFENDPNLLVKPADSLSSQELFYKMMLSVLLVVVLGVAAIYILKKFGSRITNLPGKKIHLIETVHLGQRKTLHLLKIGNQQLLIGSTSESITKLADIGLTTDLSRAQSRENTESAEKSIINNQ